jgi:hypothetical protein
MGSTWTVESQINDQVLRNGVFVPGVEITVQLSDNSQVVVDVDNTQYQDPAGVKSLIQAAVDLHDSIEGLSGP